MTILKNTLKITLATGVACSALGLAGAAQASTFTEKSPINGGITIPSGVSSVGGIVLDLVGTNNNRVTTQLAASSLYRGFATGNPLSIGTQTGFTTSVIDALGGGLSQVGVRFTLFDGDTATGDFDENENTLLLNGINFGNWTAVEAEETTGTGASAGLGFSGGGFRNETLDTGWFFNNSAPALTSFFSSLTASQEVIFGLDDVDPLDNFFDFTQGVDSSLINVGTGPVVTPIGPGPEIPTPALLPGLIGMGIAAMRRRKNEEAADA
jgi:hypothetical protein